MCSWTRAFNSTIQKLLQTEYPPGRSCLHPHNIGKSMPRSPKNPRVNDLCNITQWQTDFALSFVLMNPSPLSLPHKTLFPSCEAGSSANSDPRTIDAAWPVACFQHIANNMVQAVWATQRLPRPADDAKIPLSYNEMWRSEEEGLDVRRAWNENQSKWQSKG